MLRPKKHITRQKIKEDKFITQTLQTADWVKRRQRPMILGSVALVVVAIMIMSLFAARRAAEREASILVLQAGYLIEMVDLSGARLQLSLARERYGGTRSAGRATFMLAQLLFQEGAVDSSRSLYQEYLDDYGHDDILRGAAEAGLAACLEESGDFLAAAEAYQDTAEKNRDQPSAAHYLMQAGRCYRLAGDLSQAVALYQRIADEYPNNAEADRARIEKALLERQRG
jgi:tetratricopeptide (TPR) repeat protein